MRDRCKQKLGVFEMIFLCYCENKCGVIFSREASTCSVENKMEKEMFAVNKNNLRNTGAKLGLVKK
jgi:hypothetical protein